MQVTNILIVLTFCGLQFALIHAGFEQDALDLHNKYRKKHSSPPLKLDAEISKGCKDYAQVLSDAGKLEHSKQDDRPGLGENLAQNYGDPVDAVTMWYDEVKEYNFDKPGFSMATGHFTALVWKSTDFLGIAYVKDGKGRNWVVARYKPPGNYEGEFKENVIANADSITHSKSLFFAALTLIWVLNESIKWIY